MVFCYVLIFQEPTAFLTSGLAGRNYKYYTYLFGGLGYEGVGGV